MDRQVRKLNTQKDESDNGSEVGSENDSENGNDLTNARSAPVGGGVMTCDSDSIDTKKCENCSTTASGQFHNTSKGTFCRACYSYWRRTGLMRNINLVRHNESIKASSLAGKRKPPRGMYINIDDLLSIAKKPGQGDALLKVLDEEVNNIKRQVQNNKQLISQLKNKTASGVDSFRPAEVNHFSIPIASCENLSACPPNLRSRSFGATQSAHWLFTGRSTDPVASPANLAARRTRDTLARTPFYFI